MELQQLFSAINHISLSHHYLRQAFQEFCVFYQEQQTKASSDNIKELGARKIAHRIAVFKDLKNDEIFEEQGILAVREGVVLAMMAITMEKDVAYDDIIENCINRLGQTQTIKRLVVLGFIKSSDNIIVAAFFDLIRLEFFSRTYSQNKDLQKFTLLHKNLLTERYDAFKRSCVLAEQA